jgi:hypothetical protein
MISLGWLWFYLALGTGLMLAAVQQLAPESRILWEVLFAAGFALTIGSLATYLIGDGFRPKR